MFFTINKKDKVLLFNSGRRFVVKKIYSWSDKEYLAFIEDILKNLEPI